MKFIQAEKYRIEIDGLRAYSVLAVILFHFGFVQNGFLGVDVFFVISGFLITGNIQNKMLTNTFSIKEFYIRRIKRIIPLVSFICFISIIIGSIFMLPDDLENLAQSVIATNFFNNNVLLLITTRDYWDVVNEFKPLMHTWSLGIEEQFYFIYPFIFLLTSKFYSKLLLPIIIGLTLISILLFLSPFDDYYKFYLLPFRFFELSIGGVISIMLKGRVLKNNFSLITLILLLGIFIFDLNFINKDLLLVITVVFSCIVLLSDYSTNVISSFLLKNKVLIFLGKISFSLYMWHQLILAFGRYFVFQKISNEDYFYMFILTIILSTATYYFIEIPFRYKIKTRTTLLTILLFFLVNTGFAYYIYSVSGILNDVPELDLVESDIIKGAHNKYNASIYQFDKVFSKNNKLKILVIGDSFARDWCNILLESKFNHKIEISYMFEPVPKDKFIERHNSADLIFLSTYNITRFESLKISKNNVFCIGTKNFGVNNGYFYNNKGQNYCFQRTDISQIYIDLNNKLKNEWGDHFIDLIGPIVDERNTVPVFTKECKFISQDSEHLTKSGAKYYANIVESNENFILNKLISK